MPPRPDAAIIPQQRGRWIATLALLALCTLFCALGTWQVQRRAWKLDLMQRTAQRVHAAALPMPPEAEWPHVTRASHEYRPVRAEGTWLHGKTQLAQAVTALDAGYWAMTPLRLIGVPELYVLVNRGFVPQALAASWLQAERAQDGTHAVPDTVQGLLRITEPGGGFLRANRPAAAPLQRWFSRDVAALAQAAGLQAQRVAPFFIDQGLPGDAAAAANTWPRPGMTVVQFRNSHLVYAVTWYTLALMCAGAIWLLRRQRDGQEQD